MKAFLWIVGLLAVFGLGVLVVAISYFFWIIVILGAVAVLSYISIKEWWARLTQPKRG